jgi:hypothetical protein
MIPLQKQSKREQKEHYAKQRGSWNGLCPVTRTGPNRKGYEETELSDALRLIKQQRIEQFPPPPKRSA